MSNVIAINKDLTDEKIYEELLPQMAALIEPSEPVLSNLANFSAAIFNAFGKISWAGFYLRKGKKLFLGPFQGNTACTVIRIGEGVCGTAAEKRKTVIVEDVNNFEGHIYCDPNSKSEIVLPVVQNENLFGVFDIDSYELAAFNEQDKFYLEKLIEVLTNKLELNKIKLV